MALVRCLLLTVAVAAGVLFSGGTALGAEREEESPPPQETDKVSSSSDLVLPSSVVGFLANGGAIAAGALALAALAVLVLPLFGVKLCALFNTCEPPLYQGYSAPNSVYSDYANYGQGGTYNNPQFQRRSLEYVGPILKALSNAYDRYHKKNAPE